MFRSFTFIRYVLSEVFPSFIFGILIFIFVMLMIQALRLTEFIIIHGIGLKIIGKIVIYMGISFLPAIFPMSLLFSLIFAYSRLNSDSEIIALKSLGLSFFHISFPAQIISVLVAIITFHTAYEISPWGNRQFELLINDIKNQKVTAAIREGTFSEGFYNLVLYANKVDSRNGKLQDIFIYDERSISTPITIVAKKGQIVYDKNNPDQVSFLRLVDGDIHRQIKSHIKIKFEYYDIRLYSEVQKSLKKKSLPSYSIKEINNLLKDKKIKPEEKLQFETELHKRYAISFVCIIFAFLSVALSSVTNHRSAKANGMVLASIIITIYWILYLTFESMARSGTLNPILAIWSPNVIFILISSYFIKKSQ